MIDLRERLAAIKHEQWCVWELHRWRKTLPIGPNGTNQEGKAMIAFEITVDDHNRWLRQMTTDYADLSEQEKDSDREWADKAIEIMDDGLDVYRRRVAELEGLLRRTVQDWGGSLDEDLPMDIREALA